VEEDIQTVSCITRFSILIRPHRQRGFISRATSGPMVHGKEFTHAPGELRGTSIARSVTSCRHRGLPLPVSPRLPSTVHCRLKRPLMGPSHMQGYQGHSSTDHRQYKTRSMHIDNVNILCQAVLQGRAAFVLCQIAQAPPIIVAWRTRLGCRNYSTKSTDRQRSVPFHG